MIIDLGKFSIDCSPLICIVTYPYNNLEIAKERIYYLKKMGVKKIYLHGPTQICGIKILGKGYNSVVVHALYKNTDVILKILRLDAQRLTLKGEATILEIVNKLGIGPKLYYYNNWLLIEEYIKGVSLPEYIKEKIKEKNIELIKDVINQILEQCYKLDTNNIDHGELGKKGKHIIVRDDHKVVLIDFESASLSRRPKNVTSVVQFIFHMLLLFNKRIIDEFKINYREIIPILKNYKENPNKRNFLRIKSLISEFITKL